MVQRCCALTPIAVSVQLEAALTPLKEALLSKCKSNAVKQEMEKNAELVSSAAKTVRQLLMNLASCS